MNKKTLGIKWNFLSCYTLQYVVMTWLCWIIIQKFIILCDFSLHFLPYQNQFNQKKHYVLVFGHIWLEKCKTNKASRYMRKAASNSEGCAQQDNARLQLFNPELKLKQVGWQFQSHSAATGIQKLHTISGSTNAKTTSTLLKTYYYNFSWLICS